MNPVSDQYPSPFYALFDSALYVSGGAGSGLFAFFDAARSAVFLLA